MYTITIIITVYSCYYMLKEEQQFCFPLHVHMSIKTQSCSVLNLAPNQTLYKRGGGLMDIFVYAIYILSLYD